MKKRLVIWTSIFAVVLAMISGCKSSSNQLVGHRFMGVSKDSKISEAKLVVKKLWVAEQIYYEENGSFTGATDDIFGKGSVPPGLIVDEPLGIEFFNFYITDVLGCSDNEAVLIYATPNAEDESLLDVTNIEITIDGVITGGTY